MSMVNKTEIISFCCECVYFPFVNCHHIRIIKSVLYFKPYYKTIPFDDSIRYKLDQKNSIKVWITEVRCNNNVNNYNGVKNSTLIFVYNKIDRSKFSISSYKSPGTLF